MSPAAFTALKDRFDLAAEAVGYGAYLELEGMFHTPPKAPRLHLSKLIRAKLMERTVTGVRVTPDGARWCAGVRSAMATRAAQQKKALDTSGLAKSMWSRAEELKKQMNWKEQNAAIARLQEWENLTWQKVGNLWILLGSKPLNSGLVLTVRPDYARVRELAVSLILGAEADLKCTLQGRLWELAGCRSHSAEEHRFVLRSCPAILITSAYLMVHGAWNPN